MKDRKSCIFILPDKSSEAYVAFGGGIGIRQYSHVLQYKDENVRYENVMLSTLENEFTPNTDLANESEERKRDMPKTPRIHLLFNDVRSIDAMIEALQSARKNLQAENEH